MVDKSEMQSWSLEELLEKFRKNALAFQFVPHPDYQENIKAIKQEIYLRFHDLHTKLDLIKSEASGPICASYEYDPTPTAEERLKRINNYLNLKQL